MPNEISEERLRELEEAAKRHGPAFYQEDHDCYEELELSELRTLIAGYREREEAVKAQRRVAGKLRQVQDFVAGAWSLKELPYDPNA